ncbi:MAG TPA: L-threonylcarbamoyladenylate synthase [Bacilli bacterium]|nr:L-threonylcarbamoyladenylate synthase [Bacilli bacterium]
METKTFRTTEAEIRQAAALLQAGDTVAFPTETVYGLGANALDPQAVDKIFQAKGRPSDNPLIVHIAHRESVDKLVRGPLPDAAVACMDRFWPGPLTLVLPCSDRIPSNVTAGLDTVGIRMPDHETALALIDAAGVPLAAPSANRSGRPSPTTAAHVLEDLSGKIAGVVDGGAAGVGVESTVLDLSGEVPLILRPGGVTQEMIKEVLPRVEFDPALLTGSGKPKSPGVKYTHYAPRGEMYVVEGPNSERVIRQLVDNARKEGRKTGVLTTSERVYAYDADAVVPVGTRENLPSVAAGLYDAIRRFDHLGAEVIFAESFPETGVGVAIMNRLRKAAGQRVIRAD